MVGLIFFLSAHLSSDLGEVELPNEAEIILETKELLLKFLENAYPEGGKTSRRDFHTKAHGCVNARFEVEARNLLVAVQIESVTFSYFVSLIRKTF